ncbi:MULTISPECIES: hypothetical protein [Bradyrhizobium]|uniref:hypothetical protein n=1 Tax=Bradyrhizobium TaxID=374 RepID=UPI00155EDA01|nr:MULTISPECIES: hypothetical protein [Bradyrhizobium]MDD1522604.1 hypothetical protein [Bradyrhizobium sp. WBAH30]MDD1546166.1 hypothetical protein [Bradyrhizobium sp. WBAH41]MDD1560046.1 hypothetical protein [Bradyrhizobium sp. WBAH23]MDD1567148.1 hypothetical protein [Bradyrhizobium sp. WBAH33]MDD1593456.1 hypothetical protein [Bradyrhizobium sp. WBAH42]
MTSFAQAPEEKSRTLRWLPFIAAIAAVVTAAPFAWDKSLRTFLLLISLYLPAMALVCIGLCIWAAVERKSSRARSIVISLAVMLTLIGGTFWAVPRVKDELRFLAWSHTHSDAAEGWFADKDAVMLDWESWGMVGMENNAYLVSNPSDTLAEDGGASEWLRNVGSSCDIVASKRMRRGIFIVTTTNCPLR